MSNNNENQNIVLSFIIGAAAGLAAGILLAPEAGQETRRTIATKANDLAAKASTKATDLKNKANDLTKQVGSQINNTISKISKADKTATAQNGSKGGKKPAGQPNNQPNI